MTKERAQALVDRFPILKEIRKRIHKTEFDKSVYIVGGAVRDFLIGRPPKEFDFMITLPDGGVRFARFLTQSYRVFREGTNPVIFKRFGTAAFRIKGTEFEAVMSRKEIYHPNDRNPDVTWGTREEDLARRDFTINAIAFDLSELEWIDPFGGKRDLEQGIIRTTSDPLSIFKEDPLRILRGFRFESQLGFKIVPETLAAAREMIDGLEWLARERIQAELEKMMLSKRPALALRRIVESGAMKYVFGALGNRGMSAEQDWKTEIALLNHLDADLASRLAAILHTLKPEVARDALKELRLDRRTTDAAVFLLHDAPRMLTAWEKDPPDDRTLSRMRLEMGEGYPRLDNYLDALTRVQGMPSRRKVFEQVRVRMDKLFPPYAELPEFPLSGMHIIAHFQYPPGPRIGRMLAAAREIWLGEPHLDIDDLLTRLGEAQAQPRQPGTGKGRRRRRPRKPRTGDDATATEPPQEDSE